MQLLERPETHYDWKTLKNTGKYSTAAEKLVHCEVEGVSARVFVSVVVCVR